MTATSVPLALEEEDGKAALATYRSSRRRKRIANVDLFDAFYKAYLAVLIGGLLLYGAAGLLGEAPVGPEGLAEIRRTGPQLLGLLVVLFVAAALRSGVRGGPLAFEPAEVRHVLMAPVDRRDSMGGPARAHLRHSAFLGLVFGAAAGLVASRRLPGSPLAWVAAGAGFGVLTGVLSASVAMITAGARTPRWVGDLIALPLVVWAVADALYPRPISPFSWIGEVAVVPLGVHWPLIPGVAIVVACAVAGLSLVSRSSVESAERRSRLIGQLRFAATMQDVRTVMILQRQLAQEHPRNRPLLKLRAARRSFNKKGQPSFAVIRRRCWHSLLRWPLFRYLRLGLMTLLLSALICGLWVASGALIIPAGLVLWLMAIDLMEPLAQESDHPDALESVPRIVGWTHLRLLAVPATILALLLAIAGIPAVLYGPGEAVAALFVPMVLCATLLATGGAALVVTRHGVSTRSELQTPEVTGFMTAWHGGAPPALAIAGFVPLLIAKVNYLETDSVDSMLKAMNMWWYGILAAGTWAVAWIRYGGEMKANIAESQRRQIEVGLAERAKKEVSTQVGDASQAKTTSAKKAKKRNYKAKDKR